MRNYMSTDRVPKENKVNNKLTKALNKLAKQLSDKENATVIQFRYLGDRWSVLASLLQMILKRIGVLASFSILKL